MQMNQNQELFNDIDQWNNEYCPQFTDFPKRKEIVNLVKETHVVLFPRHYEFSKLSRQEALIELEAGLQRCIRGVLPLMKEPADPVELTQQYLRQLPEIRRLMATDVDAIYDGDPAAHYKDEIILCYPGFYAISIYRMAHILYELNVPYIPRVMSEYAHEKTGIDINPGAVIGEYFCIDHGTGIVIGETSRIGDHVKLYQGVTIGARSFDLDNNGNPVKGGKRHPDIGSHTVIYANATILGGDTVVGKECVIGGNVWIVSSVPDGSKVYYSDHNEHQGEL